MRVCSILGRVLVVCAAILGGAGRLAAQSYQSSFSEVKFDRAKGPATFVSGVQVDAASGAASMEIPCGPGIGERGLRFRPNLSIRIAPQLGISNVDESHLLYTSEQGVQTWGTQSIDTIYQRGYGSSSFSPGTFDLALWGALEQQSTYSLPGGGGGSILGTVPPGMTTATAQQLLARFGVAGTIGTLPTNSTYSSAPFIQMGSSGNLILGLNQPGNSHQGTDEVQDWFYTTMVNTNTAQYRWPRRLLVIQGDVAYEFAYVSHRFVGQLRSYITNGERNVLNSAHYVVKRILNRFGENITFEYEADGIGYTATWSTNTSVKILVRVVGTASAPAMPCLGRTDYNLAPLTQVRVSYQGISQPVSSFLLELGSPAAAASLALNNGGQPGSAITQDLHGQRMESLNWGEAALTVQPVRVVQEASNETIQFTYVAGPSTGWNGVYVNPTVLSAVTFPNRVVSLNPVVDGAFPGEAAGRDTSIVAEHMHGAEACQCRVSQRLDIACPGHIAAHADGVDAGRGELGAVVAVGALRAAVAELVQLLLLKSGERAGASFEELIHPRVIGHQGCLVGLNGQAPEQREVVFRLGVPVKQFR